MSIEEKTTTNVREPGKPLGKKKTTVMCMQEIYMLRGKFIC